jgi:hypothetical protein
MEYSNCLLISTRLLKQHLGISLRAGFVLNMYRIFVGITTPILMVHNNGNGGSNNDDNNNNKKNVFGPEVY